MKSRVFATATLIAAMISTGCGGCGSTEAPTGTVSGEVTLDGTPVSATNAKITFYSGPSQKAGEAFITSGKYQALLPVGTFTVKLSGYKEPKKLKPGVKPKPEDLDTELFPAKYNKESTLSVTVKEGENKADFPCETPAPAKKK